MLASPLDLPAAGAGYALSPLQQGMLAHQLAEPDAGFDVVHVVFTIDARLDVERLSAAWQCASARYDALQTTFRWDADQPLQEPWSNVTVPFTFEMRPLADPAERERFVAVCVAEERRRGMALSSLPLQRVRVIRFSRTSHTLIWTNHHAILDGRARAIVLRDVIDAYAGRPLRPPGPAYSEHIAWLERRDAAQSEPFWRDYLRGVAAATPLPAPLGQLCASPASPTSVATRLLDADATAPLRAFAAAHALSMNTLLQAAWSLLLSRHAGLPDVVFGAVRACRESGIDGSAAIVGLLINALPVCVRIDEGSAVVPWLQHVAAQWAALRAVEHTPLRAIAGWSEIAAPAPLFESLVVYEHETLGQTVRSRLDPDGVLGVRHVHVADRTTAPLMLAAGGTDELHLRLQTDARRFASDDGERLLDQFTQIVRSIPAQAGGCVRDISMIDAAEERRIVYGFNSHSDFPRDATVHALFSEHAARTPDAVAAQIGASTMTYRDLAARSDAVAAGLQAHGIAPGSYVALCVERSFDMLAALLGILKAGAASIAIDPAHPAERSALMLRDGAVTIILAQAKLVGSLEAVCARVPAARIVTLDEMQATAAVAPAAVAVGSDDAAHVMFTSGSTGTPKGAVLGHRAVIRTVRGAEYLHFGADETFFAFVPLTFDVAILEIWGPLLNGARLVLCPPGMPSLDVLAQTIESQRVTTLWLTTALFEEIVEEHLPRLRGVRQLIVGGDVMSPAHARRAMAALPATRLINVYGPTEATVLITAQPLLAPPDGPIPLGAPIANAAVYILNDALRPVPIGVPGEIYTGGDGLARGYLNRPDLTAERFVSDPFAGTPGAMMYRTGDLARWRADGRIDFLGRTDNQVKIRGVRVELGEIEGALTEHPAVREAVAIAAPLATGERAVIAYVVRRAGMPLQAAELTAFLGARLPQHAVPARVLFLEALPRTPTGKFDRKALPELPLLAPAEDRPQRDAPATAAEITVAAHVAQTLGLEEIGFDDDFYAFGGDSLRAMRLVARLRDAFCVDLSVRDLIAAPTVAGLTSALVALTREPNRADARITALRTTGSKAPLYFMHGDLVGGGYYCRELARRIDAEHPFYAVAPHGAGSAASPGSIEAMAAENVAAIRAMYPNGPVRLGGFCNGGVVAFETARQLESAGVRVEQLAIVDGDVPNAGRSRFFATVRRCVRRVLEAARILRNPRPATLGAAGSWEAWHEQLVEDWHYLLGRYIPRSYGGTPTLLWSDEREERISASTAEWRLVAPLAKTDRVPGSHLTSMTRHLSETCDVLAAHLNADGAS